MIAVARTDTSVVGRWWWTVDRWTLLALALLLGLGAFLTMAASRLTASGERRETANITAPAGAIRSSWRRTK